MPAAKKRASKKAQERGSTAKAYELRLYVAGQTSKSIAAFANLKKICEEHLAGRYRIEVIDLLRNPHLGKDDQILATPTLVRKLPQPISDFIGGLSNYPSGSRGAGFETKSVEER